MIAPANGPSGPNNQRECLIPGTKVRAGQLPVNIEQSNGSESATAMQRCICAHDNSGSAQVFWRSGSDNVDIFTDQCCDLLRDSIRARPQQFET